MIIVSIFDRVSQTYGNLVVTPSLAFAGRELVNLIDTHPDHVYATNTEDFYLCAFGEYNPASDDDRPIDLYDRIKKIPLASFLNTDTELKTYTDPKGDEYHD